MSAAFADLVARHRRLEQLAAQGAWTALGPALAERDALLASFTPPERERALLEARRCTESLTALATAAKHECAEALKALRQGRRAAMRYVTVRENIA